MVYVHTSGCLSYLLAAPSVSGKVRMAEGDTAASVGWPGVVGSLLLCADAVQVVVASPCTPLKKSYHKFTAPLFLPPWSFYFGVVPSSGLSSAMLVMAPLTAPTVVTTNQVAGN